MWPYDINLGPLAVNLYGIMTALGAAAGIWILRFSAPPSGLDVKFARDLAFWALLWGLVGSRAAYVLFHWRFFAGNPLKILDIWSGGLMFQGGILGGALAAALAMRRRRASLASVGDALAPALSLGQAIGRAGCFFSGCCYGKTAPDGFPFALVFPAGGGAPPGRPLYPVQAMEGIGLVVLTLVLFRLYKLKGRPKGLALGAYLAGAGLLRLAMEAFRGDFRGRPFLGLPPTSWAAILTAACGVGALAYAAGRRNAFLAPTPAPGCGSDLGQLTSGENARGSLPEKG
ncbi:MAG: prolipoprotein diacylglyceryl transferase [Deltaproteobacteria bacterium]|jgi:phosphatidylglycerol:prolipoprotein diacylglycerol transferase|nr:prolipoprotein diacylglyceryl transferase [Deltaproteobacteria bacterium]